MFVTLGLLLKKVSKIFEAFFLNTFINYADEQQSAKGWDLTKSIIFKIWEP